MTEVTEPLEPIWLFHTRDGVFVDHRRCADAQEAERYARERDLIPIRPKLCAVSWGDIEEDEVAAMVAASCSLDRDNPQAHRAHGAIARS